MWPIKNCQLWKRRTLLIYGKMKMGLGPLIHFQKRELKTGFHLFYATRILEREKKRNGSRDLNFRGLSRIWRNELVFAE